MSPEPTQRGPTVAVTGACGYVAGRLIRSLCDTGRIERVLGFDVRDPGIELDRFSFERVDVRSPAMQSRLNGVDVLVHLAFVMNPIHHESEMRDVNVNGSQNVFRCAGRAGVRKIVYKSSATVYGAHPDNEMPLSETSSLRANLDFSYSAHKLEVEYVAREMRELFPRVTFTILRPCTVLGPHTDNAWSHMMELPVLMGVRGHEPPFQFVHEDDVAEALVHAVDHDLDGVFNLAPDGWMTTEEVLSVLGKRRVDLSEPVLFALWNTLWSTGVAEAPPGMLHYVMYPWVVTNDKLTSAGFTPSRSSREAFTAATAHVKDSVRIGRRRMRRSDLAKTAAAGAGLVGAAATVLAVRSRRSA